MRLGFVGVGRWASKLAEQFRACGAEIVAYDRKSPEPIRVVGAAHKTIGYVRGAFRDLDGFGEYRPWREQIEDPRIDAIVACADPETTTAVALACAAAGKPVMATKPLMLTALPDPRAPFYVDLWRLWGDRWKRAKDTLLLRSNFEGPRFSVGIALTGKGPLRSFPGSLDYGPHAMAFALDAFESVNLLRTEMVKGNDGSELLMCFMQHSDKRPLDIIVGNNGPEIGHREVLLNEHTIWEEPSSIDPAIKNAEIRAMCGAFLGDIAESKVDHYTLDLSIRGMRLLQEARKMAEVAT